MEENEQDDKLNDAQSSVSKVHAVSPSANESGEEGVNAQGEAQPQQHQPTKLESLLAISKSFIIRGLIIYFLLSLFRKSTVPETDKNVAAPRSPAFNLFETGAVLDVFMYVTEDSTFKNLSDLSALVWSEKGIVYGDWTFGPTGDGILSHNVKIPTSEAVRNNGSLYLHVFVTQHGKQPSSSKSIPMASKQLNRFKRLRYTKKHNLLTMETSASKEEKLKAESMKEEIVSHWHPNLTVNLVVDQTNWIEGSVPSPLNEFLEFLPEEHTYKPIIYMNEYWNMIRDYHPINDTTKILDLRLTWQPLTLLKFQLYSAQSTKNKWSLLMGDEEQDADQDTLKETLLETSPYLLGLTAVVSILHTIFEMLAFKNDIQFWNNRKSLEGLSVRSVFFNVFQATIVFLYVLDNDTNTVIKISCFVGVCIEMWKINKVYDVKLDRSGRIPWPTFTDKSSYVASSTREYDVLAFRYLSWALYPLLVGYAVYALVYEEHLGWYSFVLNMLYGFLLTFGFIMMTPQLFINYKLKSVAHLPWRMMSYKFLNTFIDDVFAFVIKMPTLYRLGCFRDDIVFFIVIYQRWIYKTDMSRVNEFGFSAEMEVEVREQVLNGAPEGPSNDEPFDIAPAPPTDPELKKKE